MKQITQRLKDGRIELREVPVPDVDPDSVLVALHASLLSAGTERTKVQTARKSLLGKARARPDQVQQVVEKARRDGVRETIATVRSRLEEPTPLGYSAAGTVLAVGDRVRGIAPGDRVACAGEGAAHAEVVRVRGNLCVRMPAAVDWEQGAFTTLGSIALHGVRQADVRIGERVAVIGLGLVGQLSSQILRAAGCSAVGIDVSNGLVEHAVESGAVRVGYARSNLDGTNLPADASDCDAVIVAASTDSSDPVELAAALCRDRGRVVVVGAVGMDVPRGPYYDKELKLTVSRSYGPGRYDREYEERGLDYPIGYVRWTEQRNMEAFLELLADRSVEVDHLISRRIPLEQAGETYDALADSSESPLGIVLEYPRPAEEVSSSEGRPIESRAKATEPTILGVIGAGSFAQRILIPAFESAGFELAAVASQSGLSASAAAERFRFERAVSPDELIADNRLGTIAIATRHASHASLATAALESGHAVFVEKPPCLTEEELQALRTARESAGRPLAVGFNRRHAPLAILLREQFDERSGPAEILIRVNAGRLAADHWLNDPQDGGGRLLGEGCHFVDLACWLTGDLPRQVSCTIEAEARVSLGSAQRFSVTLAFADGSSAVIAYHSEGNARLGKERIEMHADGTSAVLDDYRSLTVHGSRRTRHRGDGDKGHRAQIAHFREQLEGAPEPGIDPLDTMAVTLAAARSARSGE